MLVEVFGCAELHQVDLVLVFVAAYLDGDFHAAECAMEPVGMAGAVEAVVVYAMMAHGIQQLLWGGAEGDSQQLYVLL